MAQHQNRQACFKSCPINIINEPHFCHIPKLICFEASLVSNETQLPHTLPLSGTLNWVSVLMRRHGQVDLEEAPISVTSTSCQCQPRSAVGTVG